MKVFSNSSTYEHPWERVTLAFWNKYSPQNPYVSHIGAFDVFERRVDPHSGTLKSSRIILKKGSLPLWGKGFMKKPEATILEESEVDSKNRTLVARTRNVSHTSILSVVEVLVIKPHPENENWTQIISTAHIISKLGFGLEGRLEQFGLHRFINSAKKSRDAMKFAVEKLTLNFSKSNSQRQL